MQIEEINTAQPQSLTATAGDYSGEVDLTWEPVSGAKNYVIQKTTGHHRLRSGYRRT